MAVPGWQFAAIAIILASAGMSADRSVEVAASSGSGTPAIENREALALFMLTMAVDYL